MSRDRGRGRPRVTRAADVVYGLAVVLIGPFYALARVLRKKTSAPVSRRLGRDLSPRADVAPLVWIHAVSVGEVTAVAGLVAELAAAAPGAVVRVTTTTTSGLLVARRLYGDAAVHESPLDFSWCVRRFFDAWRPRALVLVEGELWPNLLSIAEERGVAAFVVNARVSDRSAWKYRLVTRLWPSFLRPVTAFLLQSNEEAPRFIALGVDRRRLAVAGNLKFDNARIEDPAAPRAMLRAELGIPGEALVVVAGSTHPGEEEDVVRAFEEVRREFRAAVLVLAPRHLERIPEVLALLRGVGLGTLRFSERTAAAPEPCVLVDTVGELSRLYAAADVAFVGGSLRPIGGHNLLEPARFGIPMVTGPHLRSVRSLAATFEQSGALAIVEGRGGLVRALREAFADPSAAARRGRTAQAVVAQNQGAARRCAEAIAARLRDDGIKDEHAS